MMPSSSEPVMIAANSSPPSRATKSVTRRWVLATEANSRSTSSPTAWPNRSLIDLKWSRSKAITVIGRAQRALLGEHEHDEGRADRVEQHFEHEDAEPPGRERHQPGLMRHEARDRDREEEDGAGQGRD